MKKQLFKDSIYRILESFDKIYSEFTDAEKKRFIGSFVERVEIYEEEQENGRFLKSIKFRFPVYYNGTETQEVDLSDPSWDYQRSLETVVLLCHQNIKKAATVDYVPDGSYMKGLNKHATYKEINEYVQEKYGFRLHSAYIAQVKREMGIEMGENYNLSKSEDYEPKLATPEKKEAIIDALKHFNMID